MTRVMIVDDSEESRSLLKYFLLAHNYDVVAEASDGFETIEKYYSNQPKFIFLDLVMPNLDGLSVLKNLISRSLLYCTYR